MRYLELDPPRPLASVVRCAWFLEADHQPPQRVLPDGCPEIVVNRRDPFRVVGAPEGRTQPTALLVGQLRTFLEIAPTGGVDLVGIRLEPGGVAALLGGGASEVTGIQVELRDLGPLGRDLEDAVRRPGRPADVARRAWRVLLGLRRRAGASPLVREAVYRLQQAAGRLPVERLAADVQASRRHLERRFREEVGLTPKALARIFRFQAVVQALETLPAGEGARLAAALGFSDQAHLVREFKTHAGITPTAWLREESGLADLFRP